MSKQEKKWQLIYDLFDAELKPKKKKKSEINGVSFSQHQAQILNPLITL